MPSLCTVFVSLQSSDQTFRNTTTLTPIVTNAKFVYAVFVSLQSSDQTFRNTTTLTPIVTNAKFVYAVFVSLQSSDGPSADNMYRAYTPSVTNGDSVLYPYTVYYIYQTRALQTNRT